MEKSPYKNDFTAPPLLWTVSPLDACAQSHNMITTIKTELAQEAGMPKSARKGPVRTCKNETLHNGN